MENISHGNACIFANCKPAQNLMKEQLGNKIEWITNQRLMDGIKMHLRTIYFSSFFIEKAIKMIKDFEIIMHQNTYKWGTWINPKIACAVITYVLSKDLGFNTSQERICEYFKVTVVSMRNYFKLYIKHKKW